MKLLVSVDAAIGVRLAGVLKELSCASISICNGFRVFLDFLVSLKPLAAVLVFVLVRVALDFLICFRFLADLNVFSVPLW